MLIKFARRSVYGVVLATSLATAASAADDRGYANPHLLVTVAELAPIAAAGVKNGLAATALEGTVLVDVRPAKAFDAGHIPGAIFVDLDTDLSGSPTAEGGRHPLPSPDAFAAAMGRLGIGESAPVVGYDDSGGMVAARLWWMLDTLGQPAAVLDGDIDAWPGPLETSAATPEAVEREPRAWPAERFASAEQAEAAGARPDAALVDARAGDRYRGEPNPIDTRFGHIPGAESIPYASNLAEGRFRPAAELREIHDDRPTVAYCGSGVSACHDLLARAIAGREPGRLFVGSWSAWAADPDRPVERPTPL